MAELENTKSGLGGRRVATRAFVCFIIAIALIILILVASKAKIW